MKKALEKQLHALYLQRRRQYIMKAKVELPLLRYMAPAFTHIYRAIAYDIMFCRCCLVYSTAPPLKDVLLYSDKKAVLGFKTRYAFPRCTCLSRGEGRYIQV